MLRSINNVVEIRSVVCIYIYTYKLYKLYDHRRILYTNVCRLLMYTRKLAIWSMEISRAVVKNNLSMFLTAKEKNGYFVVIWYVIQMDY